jgi:orotate phosphoribosyltransferase
VSRLRIYNPMSRRDERQRLLQIVASCLSNEPFRRSDGQVVSNYVQGHLVLGDPDGLRLASKLMLDVILATPASVIAGEVSAACALVSSIVTLSGEGGRPLTGRYVRKELRPYGMPGWLNAPIPDGSDVFLVDDVSATGASGVRCAEVLRSLEHNVVAMMVVVDRDQGAAERLARLGVDLWTLFTLEQVRNAGTATWRTAASG